MNPVVLRERQTFERPFGSRTQYQDQYRVSDIPGAVNRIMGETGEKKCVAIIGAGLVSYVYDFFISWN